MDVVRDTICQIKECIMTLIFLILGCRVEDVERQSLEDLPKEKVRHVAEENRSSSSREKSRIKKNQSKKAEKRSFEHEKNTVKQDSSLEKRINTTEALIASHDYSGLEQASKEVVESPKEVVESPKEVVESPKEVVESPKTEIVTPKKTKVQYSRPTPQCTQRLKKILREKNGDILFCYDKQKIKRPSLEGNITVQINIHRKQNSIWVKKDTLKDKGLRSCIKSKIKHWEFGSECHGSSFKKSYKLVSG